MCILSGHRDRIKRSNLHLQKPCPARRDLLQSDLLTSTAHHLVCEERKELQNSLSFDKSSKTRCAIKCNTKTAQHMYKYFKGIQGASKSSLPRDGFLFHKGHFVCCHQHCGVLKPLPIRSDQQAGQFLLSVNKLPPNVCLFVCPKDL